MRRFIYILIFLNSFSFLWGQEKLQDILKEPRADTTCYVMLREAENNYRDGLYLKCIDDLNSIWKSCSFSKKEREEVLELLAKAYIEVGRTGEADRTISSMLHNNPHYELREAANSEDFNLLVKKYNIHPLITIGVRNTADWVTYKTAKVFSVLPGLDYNVPYSKYKYGILSGFGFMYYGTAEVEFDKHFSLNGDLTFWWVRYQRDIKKAPGFNLSYWETDNYMEIPIYVKRYFPIGNNILPYITAGIGWNYMTRASGNATISYTKDDVVTGKNIDFDTATYEMDMMEMRNRNTFEWIAGAGIGYKIKNLRIFLDVRYYGGLNSFTDPKKELPGSTLIDDYFYIDNSVKLKQFEIGVSISYTLFNSIKKSKR